MLVLLQQHLTHTSLQSITATSPSTYVRNISQPHFVQMTLHTTYHSRTLGCTPPAEDVHVNKRRMTLVVLQGLRMLYTENQKAWLIW